jgi:hypothetical protein
MGSSSVAFHLDAGHQKTAANNYDFSYNTVLKMCVLEKKALYYVVAGVLESDQNQPATIPHCYFILWLPL